MELWMTETGFGNIVTVFGASKPEQGDEDYNTAMDVGRTLGEMGYGVANGGYGGTMEASARGAKLAGRATVGVTCGMWKSSANEFIDREIPTASLTERLGKLIELGCCGYVVLPGATGTLVELAMVWELACKRFGEVRPIVCVGEFWRPLFDMMCSQRARSGECVSLVADADGLRGCLPDLSRR